MLRFFLGQLGDARRQPADSKKYYTLAVKYSEQTNATESGYYLYSLIALGEIADKEEIKRKRVVILRRLKAKPAARTRHLRMPREGLRIWKRMINF